MAASDAPYEAPSVEEVGDGQCPVATSSMFISTDG